MAKEPTDKAENKSLAQEYYEGKAQKSAEGRQDVEINIVNTRLVRFTKDIGFIKKGHVQKLSDAAFEIYEKQGAIELVN